MTHRKLKKNETEVIQELSEHYRQILSLLDEDINRKDIILTPKRAAKAFYFLTHGKNTNPAEILESATFEGNYNEMVLVKDIEIYSLCEHHLLPFFGRAHVAYIPNKKMVGLSKIPRVVDAFAKRLQVQERLTTQIRDCIQEALNPLGVAVVIEAKHLCMLMRGVQKQNSVATTSAFTGAFMNSVKTREEFMHLISSRLH